MNLKELLLVGVVVCVESFRKRTFGCATGTFIKGYVQHQKLRNSGHVLRMLDHRLLTRVLFSMSNSEWLKQSGGQPLTWQQGMNEITKRLGASRLPGWGPRDPNCAWLETLQVMADNRCCRFLSRLPKTGTCYARRYSLSAAKYEQNVGEVLPLSVGYAFMVYKCVNALLTGMLVKRVVGMLIYLCITMQMTYI
ncbi:hypothetical protein T265_06587 [Opisthorchis viverrini]|uniref:Uncharacterized protein n=1 Tax=Opisthorchis viverrini TaxID=6198 RepID=A0A074ZK05_OPIVI|nr:hypothetical protein T265_06587 [Opisthorchis viverrini]KER26107.1 hypothetical protein T265_06587 [Opisthorchis viverrini]